MTPKGRLPLDPHATYGSLALWVNGKIPGVPTVSDPMLFTS